MFTPSQNSRKSHISFVCETSGMFTLLQPCRPHKYQEIAKSHFHETCLYMALIGRAFMWGCVRSMIRLKTEMLVELANISWTLSSMPSLSWSKLKSLIISCLKEWSITLRKSKALLPSSQSILCIYLFSPEILPFSNFLISGNFLKTSNSVKIKHATTGVDFSAFFLLWGREWSSPPPITKEPQRNRHPCMPLTQSKSLRTNSRITVYSALVEFT